MAETEPYVEPEVLPSVYPEPESEPEGLNDTIRPEWEPAASTISDPKTIQIMSIIAGLMSSGIIIENIVVLFVIFRAWPKQNPTLTYFIIHLACADLVSGLQFLWFNCIDAHLRVTHEGIWILVLCGLWMITIAASVGGIINFAHLRIHALKNAMKNKKYSRKQALITIALSWLLPILALFIPPLAGWNCIDIDRIVTDKIAIETYCSQVVFPFTKVYELVLTSLLFVAIAWLSVLYIWIFVLVHRRMSTVKSMSANAQAKQTERQLLLTMVIILGLFFLCHFPIGLVLIFDYMTLVPSEGLVDAFQIILTVSFLNALLNPLIYYWRMPATRDSFWLAFGKRDRTQNKMQYSSVTAISKNEKNTLSIVEAEAQLHDKKSEHNGIVTCQYLTSKTMYKNNASGRNDDGLPPEENLN